MSARDLNNDPLTYYILTLPTNGVVYHYNLTSAFTYTGILNFYGSDSFTFYVFDGKSNSTVATVYITVLNVDDPPVALNETFYTNLTKPIAETLPESDIDSPILISSILTYPDVGDLELQDKYSGIFTYVPFGVGTFNFTYKCNDGTYDSNIAVITIVVTDYTVDNKLGVPSIVGIAAAAAVLAAGAVGVIYIFAIRPRIKKEDAELEKEFENGTIVNNPLFQEALAAVNPLYES